MLDVLMGEGLMDVCAVVTRYFGGTLLGTGGLVRAYSGAVKEGLANAQILEKKQGSAYGSDHRLQWSGKDPVPCSPGRH